MGLASAVLVGALLAGAAQAATPVKEVRAWREANEKAVVADFIKMLAMPNVATNVADIEKNADYLTGLLKARGFTAEKLYAEPDTPPSVFGELKTKGARRTVVFYAHYDGQPIAQKGWLNDPFQPTMRTALPEAKAVDWQAGAGPLDPEWRLFGRSAGDDKVSVQALLSAMDALKAAGRKPSVNIKVLWEGEEEQGSPHFAALVNRHRETLKTDLIIMGDGPVHQSGRQQLNFGNRGIVGFKTTVYGPIRPLHDGHYGSWAPSPTVMIANLVMSLRDEDGRILVPGIYDDVQPVSPAEKAALAALPDVETGLKRNLAIGRNVGGPRLVDGYMTTTLNVRAIHGGDTGPDAANAIATEADASFDIRLAAGQTPERVKKAVEAHLAAQGWTLVRETPDAATRGAHPRVLKIEWDQGGSRATRSAVDSPPAMAVAAAIERTVGYPPIKIPTVGASSGMVEVVDALQAPMVGVSIANFDNNQHAVNENLKLDALWRGIEIYAALLSDMSW
ncbi:MAG: M20/M25/M40 family metallo-hydrolase [Phenylobacterium sp.]|uniref:M20/M25/M40 family metallo-hydrolase n=1 Tax=Phenylobacterium sp. TaxID=1871053 RepID=UPI001A4C0733|nr:M20/M25/M40 family metallo-hydrolase [Phenylobacterium sp.]MBL8553242.1 M20/M25/M40 family metallo-hydrolase [Phenylobacterium sp.]